MNRNHWTILRNQSKLLPLVLIMRFVLFLVSIKYGRTAFAVSDIQIQMVFRCAWKLCQITNLKILISEHKDCAAVEDHSLKYCHRWLLLFQQHLRRQEFQHHKAIRSNGGYAYCKLTPLSCIGHLNGFDVPILLHIYFNAKCVNTHTRLGYIHINIEILDAWAWSLFILFNWVTELHMVKCAKTFNDSFRTLDIHHPIARRK